MRRERVEHLDYSKNIRRAIAQVARHRIRRQRFVTSASHQMLQKSYRPFLPLRHNDPTTKECRLCLPRARYCATVHAERGCKDSNVSVIAQEMLPDVRAMTTTAASDATSDQRSS
jgi:hypothetical protein